LRGDEPAVAAFRSRAAAPGVPGAEKDFDAVLAAAIPPTNVYADALTEGWLDWSWGGPRDFGAAGGLDGSRALEIRPGEQGSGLSLPSPAPILPGSVAAIEFHVKGGVQGQKLMMSAWDSAKKGLGAVQLEEFGGQPVPGVWKRYLVPLSPLQAATVPLGGFMWQEASGAPDGSPFLFDRIRLHRMLPE
jgi:hypothetical protein